MRKRRKRGKEERDRFAGINPKARIQEAANDTA